MFLGGQARRVVFAASVFASATAVQAQQEPSLTHLTLNRLDTAISALERVALGMPATSAPAAPKVSDGTETAQQTAQRPAFIRRNTAPKCFGNIDQPRETVEELEADLNTYQNAARRTSVFLKQFQEITLLNAAPSEGGETCSDFQKAILAEAQKSFQTVEMNALNGLALHLQYCRITESDAYNDGTPVDADVLAVTAQEMIFLLLDARQQLAEASEGCT